jgi:hypothetical protein
VAAPQRFLLAIPAGLEPATPGLGTERHRPKILLPLPYSISRAKQPPGQGINEGTGEGTNRFNSDYYRQNQPLAGGPCFARPDQTHAGARSDGGAIRRTHVDGVNKPTRDHQVSRNGEQPLTVLLIEREGNRVTSLITTVGLPVATVP